MELNVYLKFMRMAAGLTQTELANRMSCSKQNIAKNEKSAKRISIDYLSRFATAVGKTPSDLLAGYEKVQEAV